MGLISCLFDTMSFTYTCCNGKCITYTVHKRAYQKRINLIAHQDGSLIVSTPKMCTQKEINRILKTQNTWIEKYIACKQKNITVDPIVVKHMKKILRPIVLAKLMQFNTYYNFTYHRVSIRNQRSRWGSCSSEGNLNFNCKLMCVSNELREYVIAHELCHLKEMNHSPAFWKLVEKTVPNYKELRRQLKNIAI